MKMENKTRCTQARANLSKERKRCTQARANLSKERNQNNAHRHAGPIVGFLCRDRAPCAHTGKPTAKVIQSRYFEESTHPSYAPGLARTPPPAWLTLSNSAQDPGPPC